jgi:glutathione S-transferase
MENTYRLVTIPPSHYCEKARWALDHFGVSFDEEAHPPMLHYLASRRAGGGRTVPVLVTDLGVYRDSTDILQFLESRHGDGVRLYPEAADLRGEVDELEELFDTRLGPHTRRLAYHHLLPHRRLMAGTLLYGASSFDRSVFNLLLPLMRFLLRRGLRITPESAERSLGRVREVFTMVRDRLADGRSFLVGEVFSAADLSFAALAAPVLLPRGYGAPLPSLAEVPASLLPLIEELRGSEAGEFALRLYRDHR